MIIFGLACLTVQPVLPRKCKKNFAIEMSLEAAIPVEGLSELVCHRINDHVAWINISKTNQDEQIGLGFFFFGAVIKSRSIKPKQMRFRI